MASFFNRSQRLLLLLTWGVRRKVLEHDQKETYIFQKCRFIRNLLLRNDLYLRRRNLESGQRHHGMSACGSSHPSLGMDSDIWEDLTLTGGFKAWWQSPPTPSLKLSLLLPETQKYVSLTSVYYEDVTCPSVLWGQKAFTMYYNRKKAKVVDVCITRRHQVLILKDGIGGMCMCYSIMNNNGFRQLGISLIYESCTDISPAIWVIG